MPKRIGKRGAVGEGDFWDLVEREATSNECRMDQPLVTSVEYF
jgi:hypothetical protein